MTSYPMPAEIAACFNAFPPVERQVLKALRQTVLNVACERSIAPMVEAVKWGQPSLAPPKKFGTPVRLGLQGTRPALFVHCGSPVIARFREIAPEAELDGNRAYLPRGADDPALPVFLGIALGYRRA